MSAPEHDEEAAEIVVECELDATPAAVWRALTEPALLARWLLPNDIRPEPGARFAFEAGPETGGGRIECEVLAAERERLLRYTWRGARDAGIASTVSFELTEAVAGGTHLRLVHSGLSGGFPIDIATPLTTMAAGSRAGAGIVSLALALAGRARPIPCRRAA